MKDISFLDQVENAQAIVVVSNPEEQVSIRKNLSSRSMTSGEDYFFLV